MRTRNLVFFAASAAMLATATAATASISLRLHSTGESAPRALNAAPAPLYAATGGGIELNYLLVSAPSGAGPATVTKNNWGGFWLADNTTSRWISDRNHPNSSSVSPVGNYVFRYTFDLTGFSLSSILSAGGFTGRWASDNQGSVWLNGTQVSANVYPPGSSAYGSWTNLTLSTGLNAGLNTLEFRVNNAPAGGGNPVGLRVEWESIVVPTAVDPVPEPFTMGLVGAAALAALKRRKKK